MKTKKGVSLLLLIILIVVMVMLLCTIIVVVNNNSKTIINSNVISGTLEKVQQLADKKWKEVYKNKDKTEDEIKTYILEELENENIDITKYNIIVGPEGVAVLDNWLVGIVDDVPIPRGFVASGATGENTKAGGLVIYEGNEEVTDENVEVARRTRNQYVWVPVESEEFKTKFVRSSYDIEYKTISNFYGLEYWEVELDLENMPVGEQNSQYISRQTLEEIQNLYESVKKYEGFYIARYEAGIDHQRTEYHKDEGLLKQETIVYSVMGKIPYNIENWGKSMSDESGGVVEVARNIYPKTNENYGAVSTLTYGVQWDTILQWWLDTRAVTSIFDSTEYGNYKANAVQAGGFNYDARYAKENSDFRMGEYEYVTEFTTKQENEVMLVTTGAIKAAKVNNIYDMAGNVAEWTMEGYSTILHVLRGSSWSANGTGTGGVLHREVNGPAGEDSWMRI